MDVLWDVDVWLTARDVAAQLDHERDLAYTTVLTVLERLERKGFVQRERAERAHRYRASSSRDAVVAEAMLAALDTTEDRGSALVRFVGSVSPAEAEILRRALAPSPEAAPEHDDATVTGTGLAPGDPVSTTLAAVATAAAGIAIGTLGEATDTEAGGGSDMPEHAGAEGTRRTATVSEIASSEITSPEATAS
ncbi:CopY family transcriptional regulator [Protofrankia sp. BMG5.30]|uniref:CopY family transcriptional regulator n=2 Tax=Frankiaceae TaxID=74712 RepID=A0ABR5F3S3_9ACTN|nr:CopY family transcriptional regulator [Protofrankia coriariae]ONH34354.1 CopY family transcriptional regulator [Protofrankia sp. BMG5.30]